MGYVGKIGLDRDCVPTGPGSELMESAGRMDKWCRVVLVQRRMSYQKGAMRPWPRPWLPEGKAGPICCQIFNLKSARNLPVFKCWLY